MKTFKKYLTESQQFFTDRKLIAAWLDGVGVANYVIQPDLTVDVKDSLDFEELDIYAVAGTPLYGYLPVQFGQVDGYVNCDKQTLKSLRGMPKKFTKYLSYQDCDPLENLEGIPTEINGSLWFAGTTVKSLIGISDLIHEVRNSRDFIFQWNKIEKGGLGLVLIKGLTHIGEIRAQGRRDNQLTKPFEIIQKYLGQPDKIYECQNELLDNGFGEFAKL